ncbi:carbohydrate ABC transporter permease [Trebonia kvetii]|uniref:Carbohydrate ABC transporter permease n=1 Tax=Trebonia kvetii TaxID=2480626 RepID=A0A6P2BZE4_9ACTN|nr:carbohydrate ABC transporter permease [Trebonia kvetii]TVZ04519.1 carbohydrate ABC transporter permease [Trebonia kvetii]
MITETKPAPRLRATAKPASLARRPLRTWFIAAAAYLIALIFLLPYLEMLVMAGRPNSELGDPTILPKHFTFTNFTTLWSGGGLGGSIGTSLQIAAGATVIVLLVALPAAYCTARRKFRGRTAFLLLVLATQMFQPAAMLVGIQREFTNFGVPPTLSLIIINAGFNLAFAVWILNAFFSSIPEELEEASMVDGLGRFGALLRITLPLAAPGIVTALIFTFISAWNEFLVALTLSLGQQPSQQPLTVAINQYIGEYSVDWGHLFAAGLVATVPVIILFAFIERRVVSGLTAGAVK